MLTPRLDILPPAQRRLWEELAATPPSFALYDGTALALRLGHRASIDFDFFTPSHFDTTRLRDLVPYLGKGTTLREAPNTLTLLVDRDGPIHVSFFGVPTLGQVEPHEIVAGPNFNVASLLDLGGMKASVIYRRAEPKDYFDIHALLTEARLPLPMMLAAAAAIYGERFNPMISLKAMTHHGEEGLRGLPEGLRRDLVMAVRKVNPADLPRLKPIRPAAGMP
jgi:hypothetical protein